jgi:hypothetical protein
MFYFRYYFHSRCRDGFRDCENGDDENESNALCSGTTTTATTTTSNNLNSVIIYNFDLFFNIYYFILIKLYSYYTNNYYRDLSLYFFKFICIHLIIFFRKKTGIIIQIFCSFHRQIQIFLDVKIIYPHELKSVQIAQSNTLKYRIFSFA